MNYEDVQKVSNAANGKITLLNSNFGRYFIRAVMAGFFIVVAMIFSQCSRKCFRRRRGASMGQVSWCSRIFYRCTSDLSGWWRAFYRQ